MFEKRSLDFGNLYREASDFYAKIFSSEVLETSVWQHATYVSSAIYTFYFSLWIRKECSVSEILPSPVARGEIATSYGDLSNIVGANFLSALIE
jgi:hypothetical protein